MIAIVGDLSLVQLKWRGVRVQICQRSETFLFPPVRYFRRVDPGGLDSPGTDGAGVFTRPGDLAVVNTFDRHGGSVSGGSIGRWLLSFPQHHSFSIVFIARSNAILFFQETYPENRT